MIATVGHNGGPSFDDIRQEGKDQGLLILIKDLIIEASRDPRVERRHLRVLAEIFACLNFESAIAYPGRSTIASALRKWQPSDGTEDFGYTEAGISKTLSELVAWGYLATTRRAIEKGGRALTLYVLRRPTQEELRDQITAWIMSQRMAGPRKNWTRKPDSTSTHVGKATHVRGVSHDPTHAGGVSQPDSTHAGGLRPSDSTHVGNSTHVGGVKADSTSESTHVHPTVTRSGTSQSINQSTPPARERDEGDGEGPLDYRLAKAIQIVSVLKGSETDPDHDWAWRVCHAVAEVYGADAVLEAAGDYRMNLGRMREWREIDEIVFSRYARQARKNIDREDQPSTEAPAKKELHDDSCFWNEDRLMVANGFKTELLELVGGSEQRLRITLDKASGSVPLDLKGAALRKTVRSQFTRFAEWGQQDERKVAAIEKRNAPAVGEGQKAETPQERMARLRAQSLAARSSGGGQ